MLFVYGGQFWLPRRKNCSLEFLSADSLELTADKNIHTPLSLKNQIQPPMNITGIRFYQFLGALLALSAVLLGAFGAHALAEKLVIEHSESVWETAVRYQIWHALALLIASVCKLPYNRFCQISGLWLIGSVLFSGSLYVLALGGPRWVGPVTPMGGLCLIIGWSLLAFSFCNDSLSGK